MDLQLQEKLCVVTGSTGGIGKAIATALAKNGAYVVVNGRSAKSVGAAIDDIAAASDNNNSGAVKKEQLIPVVGDLSTGEGVAAFIKEIEKVEASKNMPVHVLVNSLGMFHNQAFVDVTDEKWLEYYQTNTMSGVRLSRHFLPKMLEQRENDDAFGRILFVSSECALRPLPHMMAYSVSKTSQLALSRGLAEMTKACGKNVTVNCILPGPTMTAGVMDYMRGFAQSNGYGEDDVDAACKAYFKDYEPTSLLARYLNPEEVAYAALFLASPLASGINGTAQHVDGGIVRHLS